MTPERVGLMGFGRIGRSLYRILYKHESIRIAAISDIADHAALEYLLKFDTIFGRFPDAVSVRDGLLFAAGRPTRMLSGASPGDVDWGALGVTTVIEATATGRTREQIEKHLERGAKRVILCVPLTGRPDLTLVPGVNDGELRREHRIVSNASCTAHCAGPLLRLLIDAFGVERAFLTTVHAYTNQQRLADVPAEDPRRGRAAAENIIPQETAVADLLAELIPELEGRITGSAINVPVPNGSVVDLVCWHRDKVTAEAINQVVRTASTTDPWRGIVAYEDEPIVSSDILRSSYSGTFDALATMVLGERVSKTLAWYDNSWGYAHRVVDLIGRFAALDEEAA